MLMEDTILRCTLNINHLLGAVALSSAVIGGLLLMPSEGAAGPVAGVADLPHADGRLFETLDAYLAHLEELGTIGIAWFQLRPDGMYERIMRRPPGSAPELYTRQELQEMFGFSN